MSSGVSIRAVMSPPWPDHLPRKGRSTSAHLWLADYAGFKRRPRVSKKERALGKSGLSAPQAVDSVPAPIESPAPQRDGATFHGGSMKELLENKVVLITG